MWKAAVRATPPLISLPETVAFFLRRRFDDIREEYHVGTARQSLSALCGGHCCAVSSSGLTPACRQAGVHWIVRSSRTMTSRHIIVIPVELVPAKLVPAKAGGGGAGIQVPLETTSLTGAPWYDDGMFIDAHCHIQFPAYDADRDHVIRRAQAANVKMVAVGTNAATSEAAIRLAEHYPDDVWATVGFHPNHAVIARTSRTQRGLTRTGDWHHDKNEQAASVPEQFDIEKLRELAAHPKVVAIGECGFDYYRLSSTNNESTANVRIRQREVFQQQIEIAKELKKPLMIHCRPSSVKTSEGKPSRGTDDAYDDLLSIIHNSPPKADSPLAEKFIIPLVVHFYVGSPAMTKKLLDTGFYFTFGGVITFSRDYDESIKLIPLERILLETDAPYVAPEPYRGKRNEPACVIEVAKKFAELKRVPVTDVARISAATAAHLFGLPL